MCCVTDCDGLPVGHREKVGWCRMINVGFTDAVLLLSRQQHVVEPVFCPSVGGKWAESGFPFPSNQAKQPEVVLV